MKLVPLREKPALTEVAARLELLAGEIRSGVWPAASVVVILGDDEDRIATFGYGRIGTAAETLGLLQMAVLRHGTVVQAMRPVEET